MTMHDEQSITHVHTHVEAPKRSWFRRHKVLTGVGIVLVLAAMGSAAGSSGGSKGNPVASQPSSSTSPASSGGSVKDDTSTPANAATSTNGGATGSAKMPLVDGDWRLDSLTVDQEEFTGDFEGRARITYIGHDSHGGDNAFTITVFKGGSDVATLTGFASDVMPGTTKTVELLSTDKFAGGAKTYTFQNDF